MKGKSIAVLGETSESGSESKTQSDIPKLEINKIRNWKNTEQNYYHQATPPYILLKKRPILSTTIFRNSINEWNMDRMMEYHTLNLL